jgi:hypothetical protein
MKNFKIGDLVLFVSKGHMWSGLQFKVKYITPSVFSSGIVYTLEYGQREVLALEDEVHPISELFKDFGTVGLEDFMASAKINKECEHKNVVESQALHQKFFYCRDCKKEVVWSFGKYVVKK